MKKIGMMMLSLAAIASMGAGGCDGDDQRLAEYAQHSVEQQARQNEQIARQNQEVTQQNRQVAEAARELVAADARARQELVTAQQTLQSGLQSERSMLDQQRQLLEQERQGLARERYWQPLIAEAISQIGVLAACLAPLLLCLFLLRSMHGQHFDESDLNELLVAELAAETPQLLFAPLAGRTPIDQEPAPAGCDSITDSPCGDSPQSGQ